MVPSYASRVVRVKASDGSMQGYNTWPSGFTKVDFAFYGGVYDGVHIWMVPWGADRVIQIRSQQTPAPPTPEPPMASSTTAQTKLNQDGIGFSGNLTSYTPLLGRHRYPL